MYISNVDERRERPANRAGSCCARVPHEYDSSAIVTRTLIDTGIHRSPPLTAQLPSLKSSPFFSFFFLSFLCMGSLLS